MLFYSLLPVEGWRSYNKVPHCLYVRCLCLPCLCCNKSIPSCFCFVFLPQLVSWWRECTVCSWSQSLYEGNRLQTFCQLFWISGSRENLIQNWMDRAWFCILILYQCCCRYTNTQTQLREIDRVTSGKKFVHVLNHSKCFCCSVEVQIYIYFRQPLFFP